MSHFTHMKTRFYNLVYLEKALNGLNISHQHKQPDIFETDQKISNINLRIPQSNGYDMEFFWNGQEYELIVDISFWEQPYPIESFIDKITQQYASEVIIGESQKMGFQPVIDKNNINGSKVLILERWNNN